MTRADMHVLRVRAFQPEDTAPLRRVFVSSIHGLATRYYTAEQVHAWAPLDHDPAAWASRLAALRPFVAELGGRAVGYADLQATGYIDHFFVAADAAGQGVGAALMRRIDDAAVRQGLPRLWANVSLSAEGFFARHGFAVRERRTVVVRGVALRNARMEKAFSGRDSRQGDRPSAGVDH